MTVPWAWGGGGGNPNKSCPLFSVTSQSEMPVGPQHFWWQVKVQGWLGDRWPMWRSTCLEMETVAHSNSLLCRLGGHRSRRSWILPWKSPGLALLHSEYSKAWLLKVWLMDLHLSITWELVRNLDAHAQPRSSALHKVSSAMHTHHSSRSQEDLQGQLSVV